MTERMVSGKEREEDGVLDSNLRPSRLAEFVGQHKIKENLGIAIEAARQRGEPLDHILLYGPPALARPRWRRSWRARWASTSASPRGPF